MSLLNLPLMNALTASMQYRDQNMKVLAGNIANADTPGAKAKTLKPLNFETMLGSVVGQSAGKMQMAATSNAHFPNTDLATSSAKATIEQKATYEVNPDKNNIILEEQLLAAQQNNSQYTLAINMYRKSIGMMKLAIGANR